MNEQQDVPTDDHEPEADETTGEDPVVELAARAREACVERPELLALVERIEQLDRMDLQRRPEELDAVHRTLREALTNAGRPASAS